MSRWYSSLFDIIISFLVKYELTELYLENLPRTQQCIGCTRDEGDHDGECPVDNPGMFELPLKGRTTQTIKKQIEEIEEIYLKKK